MREAEADFPLGPTGNPVILIAGANFGCGSSREGAVYALADAGVRCVIAPSFGDIFAANAAKNGLLTIALPAADIAALIEAAGRGAELTVDLPRERVRPDNGIAIGFAIDCLPKEMPGGGAGRYRTDPRARQRDRRVRGGGSGGSGVGDALSRERRRRRQERYAQFAAVTNTCLVA